MNKIFFNSTSLVFILVIPIFIVIILFTGFVSWSSYKTGSEAVSELIGKVSASMANQVEMAVISYFQDTDTILDTLAPDRPSESLYNNFDNFDELEKRLWDLTNISENVKNISIGKTNGDYISIGRPDKESAFVHIKNENYKLKSAFFAKYPGDRLNLKKVDVGFDLYNRQWYKDTVSAQRTIWSEIFVVESRKLFVMPRSKPIRDSSGNIQGAVLIDTSLGKMSTFLNDFKMSNLSSKSEAYIMDKDGDIVASTADFEPFVRTYKDRKVKYIRLSAESSDSKNIRIAARYISRSNFFSDSEKIQAQIVKLKKDKLHISFKKLSGLDGLNWYIVVVVPESDFNKEILASTRKTGFILAIALVSILLLVMGILNFSLNDLKALTTAAAKFGMGEVPGELQLNRKDEVGLLANAFNKMVAKISKHQKELEERVKERTQDLAEKNNQLLIEVRERQLAQDKTSQLLRALELSDEAMVVFGPDAKIQFMNPAFMRLSGYAMEDMQSNDMGLFDAGRLEASAANHKALSSMKRKLMDQKTYRGVLTVKKKNGEVYSSEMTVTPILNKENKLIAYSLVERDVTKNIQAKNEMLIRLRVDKLTDLLNRDALVRDVNEKFLHIKTDGFNLDTEYTATNINVNALMPNKSGFAVIYMDLNKFKEVNDNLGHDYGDVTLAVAGKRMQTCLGQDDLLARLGGDEFVAVIKNASTKNEAIDVGLKIEKSINMPMQIKDKKVQIGVSFGVAVYPDDGSDLDSLLRSADEEMYKAKRASRLGTGSNAA